MKSEMFGRLMQVFDEPTKFSSCIEFNYKKLMNFMGEQFIKENADIISVTEYAPAVYLHKKTNSR